MNNSMGTVPFFSNPNASDDIVEITSTAYTVSNYDIGKTLVFNKATVQTVTLPVGIQKGFTCNVVRIGAGQVNLAAGSGATANSGGSLAVPRYQQVKIASYTTNTFEVGGSDVPTAQSTAVTIATTGNTDSYIVAPCAGYLETAVFTSVSALTAHDTNFITFSITNLGLAGAGSAVMLAATDANTTKIAGAALVAVSSRSLTLSSTLADLAVVKGDILRVRYAADGTLAGTVVGSITQATFSR